MPKNLMKKPALLASAAAVFILLSACGNKDKAAETAAAPNETAAAEQAEAVKIVTLDDILAHPRRIENMERDQFRHPKETLEFFGVTPDMHVGEVWPGWYTPVIAPYLATGEGSYTAILYQDTGERSQKRNAAFAEQYVGVDGFGTVNIASFGGQVAPITEAASLDMILTFRNVHNWMGGGYGDKAFADFYAALKPGGILGVVEHRLPESVTQSPKSNGGYVQESYMKDMAKRAGFEFVGASEVNANPRDTADHPMGVWTLPPSSSVPKEGSPKAEGFDAELYKNIGESDRATLKFRKPL